MPPADARPPLPADRPPEPTRDEPRCGIGHGFGDSTCIRERGHDGLCRGKAERVDDRITYAEWYSRDGKFYRHHAYQTTYPANIARETDHA
jgi:hypothetical protein